MRSGRQGNTAAEDRNGIPAVTLGNGYTGGIPALNATYALGAELSTISGLKAAGNPIDRKALADLAVTSPTAFAVLAKADAAAKPAARA